MGRDKPTRVEGTPRGLGLYRRQGREGFFFIKNWSHLAKQFPGAFERNGQFDEWIKRADGRLVNNLKEAKAFCYRRTGELDQRKLALVEPATRYSGEDLEGIAQAVASVWIRAWQRGTNLHQLDLDLWMVFLEGMSGANAIEAKGENLKFFFSLKTKDGLLSLSQEENKLRRLIWDQGYRPTSDQLALLFMRFGSLVIEHIHAAKDLKTAGGLEPPPPVFPGKSQTWEGLILEKESENLAHGTIKGIIVAAKRLQRWSSESYQIKLPSSIDGEIALEYRKYILNASGLKVSTAMKELRFLSSLFNSGVKHKVLMSNPFINLPKDRQSTIKNRLATLKTVEFNKIISAELGASIFRKMNSDKNGKKDPSIDVFMLQAMTGTRIQEVAGLRGCDFIKRKAGDREYKCIRITAWLERGLGGLGTRGGIKTVQSIRLIPIPNCGLALWEKYADPKNLDAAFPQERPSTEQQNWGDRLKRRMKDKCKNFPGTHGWRETLINNATNSGISSRAIEMVTGKTGTSTISEYTSDELAVMQKVVDLNADCLKIDKWIDCSS